MNEFEFREKVIGIRMRTRRFALLATLALGIHLGLRIVEPAWPFGWPLILALTVSWMWSITRWRVPEWELKRGDGVICMYYPESGMAVFFTIVLCFDPYLVGWDSQHRKLYFVHAHHRPVVRSVFYEQSLALSRR